MSSPTTRVAPWEDAVLRVIALYKLSKALLCVFAGFGVRQLLHHDVAQFLKDYVLEYDVGQENEFIHKIFVWGVDHVTALTDHSIRFISYLAFFYALIFAIEGIGLYLRKHWAEYMVLISTASLLPIELYEIYLKLAWWKLGVLAGNLLIVIYLIHRLVLDAKFKRMRRQEAEREEKTRIASGSNASLNGNSHAGSREVTNKLQ